MLMMPMFIVRQPTAADRRSRLLAQITLWILTGIAAVGSVLAVVWAFSGKG